MEDTLLFTLSVSLTFTHDISHFLELNFITFQIDKTSNIDILPNGRDLAHSQNLSWFNSVQLLFQIFCITFFRYINIRLKLLSTIMFTVILNSFIAVVVDIDTGKLFHFLLQFLHLALASMQYTYIM